MLSFPQSKTSQHSSLHLFHFCPDGRERGPCWHFGSPIHPDQFTTRKLGDVVPISLSRGLLGSPPFLPLLLYIFDRGPARLMRGRQWRRRPLPPLRPRNASSGCEATRRFVPALLPSPFSSTLLRPCPQDDFAFAIPRGETEVSVLFGKRSPFVSRWRDAWRS